MYRTKYRGSVAIIAIIVIAIVILAFILLGSGSASGGSGVASSTDQASSTVSKALQFTRWVAKEYPPQKHPAKK